MACVEEFIAALQSRPIVVLLAAVLLLLFHLVFAAFSSKESRKYPPGPMPLPLVGNLLQLDLGRPYRSLYELSKKYGSVFTVYLGPKKVVVLSGYKAVRAAVDGYERQNSPLFEDPNLLGHEFAYAAFKNYGMPRSLSEARILLESGCLIETFQEHQGNPFDTTDPVTSAVSNIVAAILYRGRLDEEDPRFINVMTRVTQMSTFANSATVQFYNMFPKMLHWIKNRQTFLKRNEDDARFMKDFLMHLKETLNPTRWRGLLDSFLVQQQEDLAAGLGSLYSDERLVPYVANLFAIGTETSATLRWALLFMAKYPQIQDRVQAEVDKVLRIRPVNMEDRKILPFTNAVVHEIQRIVNILPMAIPYETFQDITFQGCFIKKGTTVFSLLTSALYDESEWESPYTFNPAHFLNEEGEFIQSDAFVAFSEGCKIDLSQSLASMVLFLLFTSLLQRFRFTAPPDVSEDQLDVTPVEGVTWSPPPHQLCAIDRW